MLSFCLYRPEGVVFDGSSDLNEFCEQRINHEI